MITKEERELLKAILEGQIKPEDSIWKHIWNNEKTDKERYRHIREILKQLGAIDENKTISNKAKMWSIIQNYKKEGRNKKHISYFIKWAAVFALPIAIGAAIWSNYKPKDTTNKALISHNIIKAGSTKAILILDNGQKIDLTKINQDSSIKINNDDILVKLDSNKNLSYLNLDKKNSRKNKELEYNTIVIPRGGEYNITLEDGSIIYLNSESELRYPINFTKNERKVYLKGEAYFEIKEDKKCPFIVETSKMSVKVLGTKFAIRAYEDENISSTTLVSGSVALHNNLTPKKNIILKPNEQATILDSDILVKKVNVKYYTAWRSGKFYFKGDNLVTIVNQLKRWYDLEFFFAETELQNHIFSGLIKKDYSANKIFEMIEKTSNVRFEINDKAVIIRSN